MFEKGEDNKNIKKEEKKTADNSWSVISLAWELGYTISVPIIVLALLGRILDKKWETAPWMMLLGIFISIIVTTYLVYKKTEKIIKGE
ncbi:MAG: AtpZ/AtpI family protein [Candidatus Moranbacteria bacterium]|jgi:F0F1-type ATP synthase assembly protein I|nr:AtpZ/AtpI family protein [Candidatus Moranbacteria bacterium]